MSIFQRAIVASIMFWGTFLGGIRTSRRAGYINAIIDNREYNLQLARTKKEMAQGLQNTKALEKHNGMLFVFSKEGFYNFHMHNVKIPLRIIWVNRHGKVVQDTLAKPCEEQFQWQCPIYTSTKPAKFVIEINP